MPKIVNVEETKKEILLAFQRCTKTKPITKVTMRDIAQEAHISHPKVLYYFGSMEDLLFEYVHYISKLYSNLFTDWIEAYKKEKELPINPIEAIDSLLRNVAVYDNQEHSKTFIQIYTLAQFDERIEQTIRETYQEWISSLKMVIKELYGVEKDHLAEPLMMLIEGVLLYTVNNNLHDLSNQKILSALKEF